MSAPSGSERAGKADPAEVRAAVDERIAAGDARRAAVLLGDLWRMAPGGATAGFLVSRFERIAPALSLVPCRLAVLRSVTLEPAIPLLRAMAFCAGIHLDVRLTDFNTYAQQLLDPGSDLYRFQPDVVLLAVQTRDIAPELWEGFADLGPGEASQAVARTVADFEGWVRALRASSRAHLIIHSLEVPLWPAGGILDRRMELGQVEAVEQINREIAAVARRSDGVYLLDYNALVARRGEAAWKDARKWLTTRVPVAAPELIYLARAWMRFLHPITGRVCKALVVDLDNTLWGGVIGEDGLAGIQIGKEYPGAAYLALQRVMLDLYRRGVLLAVSSKNNRADALEVFERHPEMRIRAEHFAALRITWGDKAESLRQIAAELNIGTDALAFVDDNPVEREWVRQQLPEVTVIDLPDDPMGYAQAVRESPVFERIALSEEDRARGRYYAEQRLRTELQESASSLEDFYRSLRMQVAIQPVSPLTLARAAQLTQKTNQLNLTTKRYSEQELRARMDDRAFRLYTVSVQDRFGDNGVVGFAVTRDEGQATEVDTLLLSCRVIGRTIETALLAALADDAERAGSLALQGWYLPTKRNAPARDLYKGHGFQCVEERGDSSRWELRLRGRSLACPPWIERIERRPLEGNGS